MAFDDAYHALTDHDDDARWAYGTGFTDPLAGVPGDLPDGVDRAELATYCLMLGDDALILSHRLQQWVTRAPELEDELALANIGLDLLGQARLLLTRAGVSEGWGRDEDDLAMRRDPSGFRNLCLAERADADFAHLVARLFALSTWRLALLDRLTASRDPMLAAIAAKGVKEVTYHRDYAAQWVVRLGDGTPLSHERMLAAVDTLTPQLAELFHSHPTEIGLASVGVAVDPAALEAEFTQVWTHVLQAATLLPPATSLSGGTSRGNFVAAESSPPGGDAVAAEVSGVPAGAEQGSARPWGRAGEHTPALAEILDEMQGVARSVPGGVW